MLNYSIRASFILFLCCVSVLAQSPATEGLRGRIEQIAGKARGRVGVAITLLETGESLTLAGGERFPMQSVYKLPIAMAVLDQVDHGMLKLDQMVRVRRSDMVPSGAHSPIRDRHPNGVTLSLVELLRFNTSVSDGTACDVLLRVVGGAAVVNRYLRGLGVNGINVETTEQAMSQDEMVQYRNWAQPEAAVALLRALHEGRGLSAVSRARLLQWMTITPTSARRIKGRLPAGTVVAHKTGTSGTHHGLTRTTNDIGIVTLPDGRHLAIAVFVSDSPADEATREGVIAEIAQAAWEFWTAR
ncbi:MAG TPA: class A beta-lactamase [Blastocatellia bacterium]|nr:class A beta-lactamase [Blastocatellia bacterium]